MSLYGVGLDTEVRKIHLAMKLALTAKGGSAVNALK